MEPTIFMAWLSDTDGGDGGWWTDQAREERHFRDWSPRAPRHLSFHTSEEGAKAALLAAAKEAWQADECKYAHGGWDPGADDAMLAYMTRHAGYEAHVTEQTVQFGPEVGGPAVPALSAEQFGPLIIGTTWQQAMEAHGQGEHRSP